MSEEVTIIAMIQVKPGLEEKVEAAIKICADNTRQEVGCHFYTVHQEIDRHGYYVFIEKWVNLDAFASHKKEAHFLEIAKVFETSLTEPPRISMLKEIS